MSKFFKITKAKRNGEQESEDKVLTSLENSIENAIMYYNDALKVVGNPEDEKFYKNCINLLEAIIPTIKNDEFWKFDGAIEVQAKLKKKAEDIVPDKYRTILINAIDENLVDPKQIAKDLAQYISEEMCEDFCKIYEIKDISELGE